MTKSRTETKRRLTLPAMGSLVVALATFGLPAAGWADNQADNLEFIIVSDDIRKQVTNVERPDGSEGDGSVTNNGHGNNADGVDSSNPGQGGGGPTGAVDPSGDMDDEAGGGGALPSKGNGKGKNK